VNQGKARRCGRASRTPTSAIVIIQDADWNTTGRISPPARADLSAGRTWFSARASPARTRTRVLYYWHSVGTAVDDVSNMATDVNLTDMETCYKTFRPGNIRKSRSRKTASLSSRKSRRKSGGERADLRGPISTNGRTYAEGEKNRLADGFRALWCIFKYNFLRANNHANGKKPALGLVLARISASAGWTLSALHQFEPRGLSGGGRSSAGDAAGLA